MYLSRSIHFYVCTCRRTDEGLDEEECGHIYPVVYASHRGLASAAGGFLYSKYALTTLGHIHLQKCKCCCLFIYLFIAYFPLIIFYKNVLIFVEFTNSLLTLKNKVEILYKHVVSFIIEFLPLTNLICIIMPVFLVNIM